MNAPTPDLKTTPRPSSIRNDWSREEIAALFALPFPELMARAMAAHRAHFDPTQVQIST
jgi:biotin synthase